MKENKFHVGQIVRHKIGDIDMLVIGTIGKSERSEYNDSETEYRCKWQLDSTYKSVHEEAWFSEFELVLAK